MVNGSGQLGLTTGVGAGSPPYTPLPGAASPDEATPLCHQIASNDGSYNHKKGKSVFVLFVCFFGSIESGKALFTCCWWKFKRNKKCQENNAIAEQMKLKVIRFEKKTLTFNSEP